MEMAYRYTDKIVLPLLIIICLLLVGWKLMDRQPERRLVFQCTESVDGVCFRDEFDGDTGICYTSTGVDLGYCQVRDYLTPGGFVCDNNREWCPPVYLPERLKELGKERRGLITFLTPDTHGGFTDAYCYDTPTGGRCYTHAGKFIGKGDYRAYADPDFDICHPGYGEACLLVPAMMEDNF